MVTETTTIMPYTLVLCVGVWVWGDLGGGVGGLADTTSTMRCTFVCGLALICAVKPSKVCLCVSLRTKP